MINLGDNLIVNDDLKDSFYDYIYTFTKRMIQGMIKDESNFITLQKYL